MVKLFMHAENNLCIFLWNWAEYFDLFMYMLKYFLSKDFYYFQNTVFFNWKKKRIKMTSYTYFVFFNSEGEQGPNGSQNSSYSQS